MATQVILTGFGPHVRFTTKVAGATVKVVTKSEVKTVPLAKVTDLTFGSAA